MHASLVVGTGSSPASRRKGCAPPWVPPRIGVRGDERGNAGRRKRECGETMGVWQAGRRCAPGGWGWFTSTVSTPAPPERCNSRPAPHRLATHLVVPGKPGTHGGVTGGVGVCIPAPVPRPSPGYRPASGCGETKRVWQIGRKSAPGGWGWLVNCGAPQLPTGAHKRRPYALSASDGIPTWRRAVGEGAPSPSRARPLGTGSSPARRRKGCVPPVIVQS